MKILKYHLTITNLEGKDKNYLVCIKEYSQKKFITTIKKCIYSIYPWILGIWAVLYLLSGLCAVVLSKYPGVEKEAISGLGRLLSIGSVVFVIIPPLCRIFEKSENKNKVKNTFIVVVAMVYFVIYMQNAYYFLDADFILLENLTDCCTVIGFVLAIISYYFEILPEIKQKLS